MERTDFLFFIASSFANRFAELPEFQEYLTINRQDFQFTEPYHCHRVILNYYKNLIPSNKKYYLAPFSIKKPFTGNIYGLIFGSNHLRGLEKFLDTAWALDKNTGEANYNIDNDDIIKTGQFSLFQESNIVKKLVLFQSLITEFIKIEPRTNVEIYQFTLESGFMPYYTREILIELQNADHIKVDMVDGKEKVRKSSFYLKYNPEKLIRISHE